MCQGLGAYGSSEPSNTKGSCEDGGRGGVKHPNIFLFRFTTAEFYSLKAKFSNRFVSPFMLEFIIKQNLNLNLKII